MNPRTEALAFRIWQYCEPKGWDCDLVEIAEALDEPVGRVRGCCIAKQWMTKVRKRTHSRFGIADAIGSRMDPMNAIHTAFFSRHDPRGMDG